jgi:hypothetical protein
VHEVGVDAAAQNGDVEAMEAHISFEAFSLTAGEKNIDIMGIVPDFQRQVGDIEVVLTTTERPNSTSDFDTQTVVASEGDEILDYRVSGRYLGATFRTNEVGGDVRLGTMGYEIQDAGSRR